MIHETLRCEYPIAWRRDPIQRPTKTYKDVSRQGMGHGSPFFPYEHVSQIFLRILLVINIAAGKPMEHDPDNLHIYLRGRLYGHLPRHSYLHLRSLLQIISFFLLRGFDMYL